MTGDPKSDVVVIQLLFFVFPPFLCVGQESWGVGTLGLFFLSLSMGVVNSHAKIVNHAYTHTHTHTCTHTSFLDFLPVFS